MASDGCEDTSIIASSAAISTVSAAAAAPAIRQVISLAHIKRDVVVPSRNGAEMEESSAVEHNVAEVVKSRTIDLSSIKSSACEQLPFKYENDDQGNGGDDYGEGEDDEAGDQSPQCSVRLRPNSGFLARYVSGMEKVNEKVATASVSAEQASAADATLFRKKGEAALKQLAAFYGIDIVILPAPQPAAPKTQAFVQTSAATATTTKKISSAHSLNSNASGPASASTNKASVASDAGSKALLRRALSSVTAPREPKKQAPAPIAAETPQAAKEATISETTKTPTSAAKEITIPPTAGGTLKAKRKRPNGSTPTPSESKTAPAAQPPAPLKQVISFSKITPSTTTTASPTHPPEAKPDNTQGTQPKSKAAPAKKRPRQNVFQQALQGLMTAR